MTCKYKDKSEWVPEGACLGELVYVKACRRQRWHLALESKSGAFEGVRRVPFRCQSWRHEGECRAWCGACDFRRCQAALHSLSHWSFLVLTYQARAWPDLHDLFKSTVQHWYALRKRLETVVGKFRYIQTWEITRRGVPHVNIAISCKNLIDIIEDQGAWVADSRRKLGMRWQWYDVQTSFKGATLEPMQVASGFGKVSTLEPLTDADRMAGYMLKLARELTGSSTKSQAPVNAPPHFRRLRASRNTLPPRDKNPDVTGTLEFSSHPDLSADAHAVSFARSTIGKLFTSSLGVEVAEPAAGAVAGDAATEADFLASRKKMDKLNELYYRAFIMGE